MDWTMPINLGEMSMPHGGPLGQMGAVTPDPGIEGDGWNRP